MGIRRWVAIPALALLTLAGCTTKPPTIAHVHIGHAITGWVETPDQRGLLVTAEKEASVVSANAEQAVANGRNLAAVKRSVNELLHAMRPDAAPSGSSGMGFGLLPAVQGTMSHMEFAAESDDASQNVRSSVPGIVKKTRTIVGKCQEIEVLGSAVTASRSSKEAALLSKEIAKLSNEIIDATAAGGYGLAQLRTDIEQMIAREDPAYTTVGTWYLLNLIRLPTGEWKFQERSGDTSGYSYDYN